MEPCTTRNKKIQNIQFATTKEQNIQSIASAVSLFCPNFMCVIPDLEQGFCTLCTALSLPLTLFFDTLDIDCPGLGIQLCIQAPI